MCYSNINGRNAMVIIINSLKNSPTVMFEQFPKNITSIIMGDFNYDRLKQLKSAVENLKRHSYHKAFIHLYHL